MEQERRPHTPAKLGGKPFEPVFDDDWSHVCEKETTIDKLQASGGGVLGRVGCKDGESRV